MSRTKFTLKAPEGVEESIISGTYYFPDPDTHEVETTNVEHRDVLRLHGYIQTSEVSITKPSPLTLGLINTDELGLTALREALKHRGLTFGDDYSREELVGEAESWNSSRRGRQRADNTGDAAPARPQTREELLAALDALDAKAPAPTPAPPPTVDPATQTAADVIRSTPAPTPTVGRPDFRTFSNKDLKGWLAVNRVDFKGNASTEVLVGLAEQKFEEIIAARQAQAA